MLKQEEYDKYARQICLEEFGESAQIKLKETTVLVIGVGGLGCPLSIYLTTMGIGKIILIDGDVVSLSNLHRQILFTYEDIGKYKTIVAAEKLKLLNPNINIVSINEMVDSENILNYIEAADIVVDGSDNFLTKYLVNDACIIRNKPLVFGSIYKYQGQVSVFNYKNGPTYRCLFPKSSDFENCSLVGVLGVLPGIIGTLMTNEVVKISTGIGKTLSGELLVIDTLNLRINKHKITSIPSNKRIESLKLESNKNIIDINELSKQDLLIDVRSNHEHLIFDIGGINIPLKEVSNSILKIKQLCKRNQRVIFYCAKGFRSKEALDIAKEYNLKNIYSLKDGISKIKKQN